MNIAIPSLSKLNVIFLATTLALSLVVRAGTEPYGTLLGSYLNVPAYSNGSVGRWSPTDQKKTVTIRVNGRNQTITTGYKWQCVEYTARFFALENMLSVAGGNANTWYSTYSSRGLLRFPNGGTVVPKTGDILCWSGGRYGEGHVAIVRSVNVSGGYVRIIQQNRFCTSEDASQRVTMTVQRDNQGKVIKVEIDPRAVGSTYTTQGWLRAKPRNISN